MEVHACVKLLEDFNASHSRRLVRLVVESTFRLSEVQGLFSFNLEWTINSVRLKLIWFWLTYA